MSTFDPALPVPALDVPLRATRTRAQQRHLLREIVAMQFKLKDQSTILGFGWSFLNPLLMLACLFLFFNDQLGRNIDHYATYLLIGLVHFTHLSNSTTTAMTSLAIQRQLTCNAVFPKELLVLGAVIASSVEFAISMAMCVTIAGFSGVTLGLSVAALPMVMILQFMLVLWLSFLLSTVYVFAADSSHIYQVLLRILFFTTPIFYSAALLESHWLAGVLIQLNPLAHLMELSRTAILGGSLVPLRAFGALLAVNAAGIVVSLMVFRKYEPLFAERL